MLRYFSYIGLLLFTLLAGHAMANPPVLTGAAGTDSLKSVLLESKDTMRVPVLIQLVDKIRHNNPDEVFAYGMELKTLAEQINDLHEKAIAFKGVGNAYFYSNDFSNALLYYLRSMRLLERICDTPSMVLLYNNVGAIYNVTGKNDMAIRYLLMALKLADHKATKTKKFIYNNLGNLAFEAKNYAGCIRYYKAALAIELEQDSNALERCIMLNNIGESYYIQNNFDSASYFFNKVINIRNGDLFYIASAYSGLGKIATAENRLNDASELLFSAQKISSANKFFKVEVEVLKNISALFKKQNNYQKAYEYYIRYKELSDSVYSTDMNKQVNELQVRFETQKKNEQIKDLNTEKQLAIAEAGKQSAARNLLIVAFIFVFIVSIALIRNILLKQKINKMLSDTNTRISEDNTKLQHENIIAQYEILKSKTNPHFLFNSLNTLSAIVFKDTIAVEYIRRFSDLYRMILETESKTLVSLADEMQVVNHYLYLQKMRFREKLIIQINLPDTLQQYAIPPFAVQMIVENAIKHNIVSRLRHLTIMINIADGNLIIENNLQKKQESVASTSTGISSIKGRYALLTHKLPSFTETSSAYIVQLPLLDFKTITRTKEDLITASVT